MPLTVTPGAMRRPVRIQGLFAAGPHSKKIVQLLPRMRDADGGPSEIATARLVNDLVEKRERIDRMMADLVRSRDIAAHETSARLLRQLRDQTVGHQLSL